MLHFLQLFVTGRLNVLLIFDEVYKVFRFYFIVSFTWENISKKYFLRIDSFEYFLDSYLFWYFWFDFHSEYLRFKLIDKSCMYLLFFKFLVGGKCTFTALECIACFTVSIVEDIFQREIELSALYAKKWFFLNFFSLYFMRFLTNIKIRQRILLKPNLTLKINLIIFITQYNGNLR